MIVYLCCVVDYMNMKEGFKEMVKFLVVLFLFIYFVFIGG